MRPNLSFENIASVLAALGASTLVACGGAAPPPVNASDVNVPSANAKPAGQSSCSANACGGAATAAAPGAAPATPAPTAPSTDAASATAASASPTAAPASPASTDATAAAPAAPAKPKPVVAKKPKPKGSPAGDASCGQGTCAADAKPKVF